MSIDAVLRFIGAAVCHQAEDRSFTAAGVFLPLCARCTGIYLSFFVTFIFLVLMRRLSGNKVPGLFFMSLAASGIALMLFDGLTSYAGIRPSNNVLRIITGTLCGAPLPALLILPANYSPRRVNSAVIMKGGELAAIICLALTAGCFIYSGLQGGWLIVSLIICAGVLALFFLSFNMLLSVICPDAARMKRYMPALFLTAAAVTAASFFHITVMS